MFYLTKVYPLFSSSSGNSTYIGDENSGILIDAGVSCKKLCEGLAQNDILPEAVKGVFITHEHSDHIKGLKVFTSKRKVPVFASSATLDYLCENDCVASGCRLVPVDSCDVEISGSVISSFSTPHDAAGSVGYTLSTSSGKKIAVATDIGEITPEIDRALTGCELVLLESNYDEVMLKNGKYPYSLKQRIMSKFGHLCNSDSSAFAKKLIAKGTTRIILGHLSRENNTPTVAENTLLRTLGSEIVRNRDYILEIAPVETKGLAVAI